VQELLITVAGPAVNFLIAGLLWCIIDFPAGWDGDAASNSVLDLGRTLLVWNLWMGIFNLIPAFPMDGGRILRAFLAMRLSYLRATYWAMTVAKVITVPGIIIELYRGSYFVVAIFIFIYLAGTAEYQAVKRREAAEALWRDSLLRHLATPPADDPPVLNG
jgi:Zn-dependent protease